MSQEVRFGQGAESSHLKRELLNQSSRAPLIVGEDGQPHLPLLSHPSPPLNLLNRLRMTHRRVLRPWIGMPHEVASILSNQLWMYLSAVWMDRRCLLPRVGRRNGEGVDRHSPYGWAVDAQVDGLARRQLVDHQGLHRCSLRKFD